MQRTALVAQFGDLSMVVVDRASADEACASARLLLEVHTGIIGWIRVYDVGDAVVVHEDLPDGEILVRAMPSRSAAFRLVDNRLGSYADLWHGSWCPIEAARTATA